LTRSDAAALKDLKEDGDGDLVELTKSSSSEDKAKLSVTRGNLRNDGSVLVYRGPNRLEYLLQEQMPTWTQEVLNLHKDSKQIAKVSGSSPKTHLRYLSRPSSAGALGDDKLTIDRTANILQ
jgi:hypothetical protein